MGKAQKATSQASCESCEQGKYSASEGELVCESCAQGTWSSDGSSKCELAADNYYLDPKSKESTPCPDNMECEGNLALPRPRTDYWVDRKLLEFAAIAYQCPRATCIGAQEAGNTSLCWAPEAYANGSSVVDADAERGESVCGSPDLMCRMGSTGPRKFCQILTCSSSSYHPFPQRLTHPFLKIGRNKSAEAARMRTPSILRWRFACRASLRPIYCPSSLWQF